jgi:hypothetical protein
MLVFLIHRARAKAGALSREHSKLVHPELGKVVTGEALMPSDPFMTSTPLHDPFFIYP